MSAARSGSSRSNHRWKICAPTRSGRTTGCIATRLFFAFTQDLPCEIFPEGTGLIIADAYGAHMHCEAPEHRLPAATRKSMTVRFAMAAALRINRLVDPQGHGEF